MNVPIRNFTLALALFAGSSAGLWAQVAPAKTTGTGGGETVTLEKFVTTASHIGTAATESDVPIAIIDRAQIDRTPYVEVADYLKSFPAFSGAGNTNDTFTNGGDGGRHIDLRGLGSGYTLILLNGRRLVSTGVGGLVDVNQIPMEAVDRVEIVASGASAIYGTDAIAGVVNLITKQGATGGEITGYYGNTQKTDNSRRQFGFSFQGAEGKVDFLIGAQYYKQNGLYSSDFDWSNRPGPISSTFPYRLSLPNNLFSPTGTGNSNYVVKWRSAEGGIRNASAPSDFRLYDGRLMDLSNADNGGDQFPFFLYTPLLRPEERSSFFAFTNCNLNPSVRLFADMIYRHAFSYNQLAPAAVPVPTGGAIVIPAANYWNQQIFGARAVDITAGNWRMVGLGPRIDSITTNTWWFNTGAAGKLSDYKWELAATLAQDTWVNRNGNSGKIDVLNNLLARRDATAFNPFTSDPKTNAALWNEIRVDAFDHQFSRLGKIDFTIDGKLMDVPAGPLSGALTAEWNEFKAYDHPDAVEKQVPLGFNGILNDVDGSRTVVGVVAELKAPIIKGLDARVAVRHDNYSDFGDIDVVQGALAYRPNQNILFRASAGQGYIVPSILELYGGTQLDYPTFNDPTAKKTATTWGTTTQVSVTRIGNPNLKPEKSTSHGGGIVFSPKAIKNFNISADFWEIEQRDVVAVSEEMARFVAVRFWASLGATDAARDAAARNPVTRAAAVAKIEQETGVTVNYAPDGGPGGLGGLDTLNHAMENIGRSNLAGQNSRGIDVAMNYFMDTPGAGRFACDFKATCQLQFERQSTPDEGFENLTGAYSSTFEGGWPRWRFVASAPWTYKGVTLVPTYNFTSKVALQDGVDPTFGNDKLGSYGTWDFQLNYVLPWTKTRVTLGVENALDRLPPLTSFATNNNVPAGSYDVKGRFLYVRVAQKF